MKGKAIILAGGSGGLGCAVAEAVAKQGGVPVIGYLSNRPRADSLAKKIFENYGVRAPLIEGDILQPEGSEAVAEEPIELKCSVTIVFAGIEVWPKRI